MLFRLGLGAQVKVMTCQGLRVLLGLGSAPCISTQEHPRARIRDLARVTVMVTVTNSRTS